MWKGKFQFVRIVKELIFWLIAILIMILFTGFQIWLQGVANDWVATIVLIVSVCIELLLIVKANDLCW